MNSLRPVLLIIFSYLAGFLVIEEVIRSECTNDVINAFLYVTGYGIIGITSIGSLIHAFKHPHDKPVATPPVQPAPPVSTTDFSQDLGTPPPTT